MTSPNDYPDTIFPSGAALELQRLGIYDTRAYGARGDGSADDFAALQAAIDAQQQNGGVVVVGPGVFPLSNILVAAPNLGTASRTLHLRGAGMYATTIKGTFHPNFNGLIGYGRSGTNPVVAQMVISDLTIDGNYSGVGGGALAQNGNDALVAAVPPFSSAASDPGPGGVFHYFQRVRFYRPPGYGFQPTKMCHFSACLFDSCGQPDLASGATHYDNLGSDWGNAVVRGCSWVNSSGNYADFVVGDDAAKRPKLVMVGNESLNHQIGGIYAAGDRCVIMGNRFRNTVAGGGVGYDAATGAGNRVQNIVAFNTFANMTVFASGLSEANGDIVYRNVASDQGTAVQTVASAATVTLPPGEEVVKISGTANITSVTAGRPGRTVTLVFTGTAGGTGLTNGSNLRIGANFVYTPDDAITLVCDGTNWYRVAAGAVN